MKHELIAVPHERERNLIGRLWAGWPLLIALIPALRTVFLSSTDGQFAHWQMTARIYWWPTILVELFVIGLAVAGGLDLSRRLKSLDRASRIALLLWVAGVAVSTALAAAAPFMAFQGGVTWIVHALFLASAVHLMKDRTRCYSFDRFAKFLCGGTVVAGALIAAIIFVAGQPEGVDWFYDLPGYAHLRHTGYVFAPAIAIGVAQLALRSAADRRFHMFALGANVAFMLWLGSRGPVLGLGIGVLVCASCLPAFRSRGFLLRAGGTLLAGAALSHAAPVPDTAGFDAIGRFFVPPTNANEITTGRTIIWLETLQHIHEKPLVGHGSNQFQFVAASAVQTFKHPHNGILQILFDWGVIAGAAFLFLLGKLTIAAFRSVRFTPALRGGIIMGVSTLFGYAIVDGTLFYSFPIVVAALLMAHALTASMKDRS